MTDPRHPQPAGYRPAPRFQQAPTQFGPRPASYGVPAEGQPSHGPAPKRYAGWWLRVLATIVDSVIGSMVIAGLLTGAVLIVQQTTKVDPLTYEITGPDRWTVRAILGAALLLGLYFNLWNQVFRQGRTGQTLGKAVVRIQLVSAGTGKFIGAGNTFARAVIAAIFGPLAFIDYLWPVWDGRKQTLHDKAAGSVVTRK